MNVPAVPSPPRQPTITASSEQPVVELCFDASNGQASSDWRDNARIAFERLVQLAHREQIELVGPHAVTPCPDVCRGDRYHVRCNADRLAEFLSATAWMAVTQALLELGDAGQTGVAQAYRLRPTRMMSLRQARALRRAIVERYDDKEAAERCQRMAQFGHGGAIAQGMCKAQARDRALESLGELLEAAGWKNGLTFQQSLALLALQDGIRRKDKGEHGEDSAWHTATAHSHRLYVEVNQLSLAFILGHELGHALGSCRSLEPAPSERVLKTYYAMQDAHAGYCGRRPSEGELEADVCGLRFVELVQRRRVPVGQLAFRRRPPLRHPLLAQQVLADVFFEDNAGVDLGRHSGALFPFFRFLALNDAISRYSAFVPALCDYARDALNSDVQDNIGCLPRSGDDTWTKTLTAEFAEANGDLLAHWAQPNANLYTARDCFPTPGREY